VANPMCKYPDPSTNKRSHLYARKKDRRKWFKKSAGCCLGGLRKERVLFAWDASRELVRFAATLRAKTDGFKLESSVC